MKSGNVVSLSRIANKKLGTCNRSGDSLRNEVRYVALNSSFGRTEREEVRREHVFNVINRRSDSSGERGVVISKPLPYRRQKEIHDEELRFPIEKPQKPH